MPGNDEVEDGSGNDPKITSAVTSKSEKDSGHDSSNSHGRSKATASASAEDVDSAKKTAKETELSERQKMIQAFEIEIMQESTLDESELESRNHHHHQATGNSDMQGLLSNQEGATTTTTPDGKNALPTRVGNMYIFLPSIFRRTRWGIVGPHWFGPVIVLFIICFVSLYFVRKAWQQVGPLSAATCTIFCILTSYHLLNASFRDPGIVLLQRPPHEPTPQCRWCDVCETYQPSHGAHCPDCNVCVAGFDHHCVWMGTCIGKNNFKQFIRFNLSWLAYLIYAVVWISLAGPMITKRPSHSELQPGQLQEEIEDLLGGENEGDGNRVLNMIAGFFFR